MAVRIEKARELLKNNTPVSEVCYVAGFKSLKELIEKGTFGVGLFTCKDIFATYEEMKAKGVEFTGGHLWVAFLAKWL